MKKETKEKISRSIERALILTAIWTIFVGIYIYYNKNEFSNDDASLVVAVIASVSFLSFSIDVFRYCNEKPVARLSKSGRVYGHYPQATNTSSGEAVDDTCLVRRFNVDGSRMVGRLDIHGNPYGVSIND